MSHGHHHHVDPDSGDGKIALAVAINLGLTVAQVIGGIVAGSLSLIADALHNFSDAIALIIAFAARKIARRPANADMTFGYGRIEAVAALIAAQVRSNGSPCWQCQTMDPGSLRSSSPRPSVPQGNWEWTM